MPDSSATNPNKPRPDFIHLRVHSEYSVSDSIVRHKKLVARAVADQQPAIAVTDLANLFGWVKFYSAARGAGIKPLCGADCWLTGVEVGTIGWLASTHCLAEYHPSHPRRGGRETDAVCRRASVAAERYALGAVSTKQRAGQRSARRVGHRARYFSFRGTPVPQSTPALHPSRCGVQCLLASVRTGNISPVRYSRK